MQKPKHVVIIAGEESGDAHAAELIREFQTKHPEVTFSGVGGRHIAATGSELIWDLASKGVTGFTEVFKHFKTLYKAFQKTKQHLKKVRPDLVILVDCPGFNLPIAKYCKEKLGLKVLYYISPQIWAWKAGRIHKIKKYVDHMAVIFPFEKTIYQQAGVPVSFVGHPLVPRIENALASPISLQAKIPTDKQLIAMLPGSRNHEIERHLPIMDEVISKMLTTNPNLHFLIPVAGTVNQDKLESLISAANKASVTLLKDQAIEVMKQAEAIVVASGTASLEAALLQKPMCIVYKSSFLTYLIASQVIKIKYLGLCNLLTNKMLAPEFLQYDCEADAIFKQLQLLVNNAERRNTVCNNLRQMKNELSENNADCTLLQLAEKLLKTNPIK